MSVTPFERYHSQVLARQLDPDPIQESVAHAMTKLYYNVIEYEAGRKGWKQKFKFMMPRKPPRGIYLYGPVGRGKSMMMDVFYDSIPLSIKKRRVHFHQFMIEVHDYIHSHRTSTAIIEDIDAAIPSLAEVISNRSRVLCFDEFHVVDVVDAMILSRLFTAIFDLGITVIMTSNWPPDDLYFGGLQRERFLPFIQLVKERMDVITIDSPVDYRARKLKEMSVYFTPLGGDTQQRIDALFEALTKGAEASVDLVNVKGRTIQVPSAVSGVARFSFAQLCERPLGAEDYLALAKRYHTIFLENIPRLGYDRGNEAKRFMTLVDVLYDNHRNLVISADDLPQKLYTGHDHAFEFQRTISRLNEMQSDGYLKGL